MPEAVQLYFLDCMFAFVIIGVIDEERPGGN
jgi:hypothetical protein